MAVVVLAILGMFPATALLIAASRSTFAFEQPTQTAVICLTCIGLTLVVFSRAPWTRRRLEDKPLLGYADDKQRKGVEVLSIFRSKGKPTLPTITAALLVLRILAARFVLNHVECSGTTYEPLVPVVLILHTLGATRLGKRPITGQELEKQDRVSFKTSPGRSVRWRDACGEILICIGIAVAFSSLRPAPSTYICAASSPLVWVTKVVQYLGTTMDAGLVVCVDRMLSHTGSIQDTRQDDGSRDDGRQISSRPVYRQFGALGISFLGAAACIAFPGVIECLLHSGRLSQTLSLTSAYIVSTAKLAAIVSAMSLCFCIMVSVHGPISSTMLVNYLAMSFSVGGTASDSLSTSHRWKSGFRVSVVLMFVGYLVLSGILPPLPSQSSRTTSRVSMFLKLATVPCLVVMYYFWDTERHTTFLDPLKQLSTRMAYEHDTYAAGANASTTLVQAVKAYRDRYGRHPPPRFDVWYNYAAKRKSVIIDDFDSMYADILPFYALEPAEIRDRTKALFENHWNDVAAVSIRDSRAHVGPHIPSSKIWMIEGIVDMINHFSEHLPDMDLAFNIHDTSRVAVPYDRMQYLQDTSKPPEDSLNPQNQFQPGRSTHWPRVPSTSKHNTVMKEYVENKFDHSTVGCSPDSLARRRSYWNVKGTCEGCALQNGSYTPRDWTDMQNVCEQPDLRRLHGAYSGSHSFKTTHKLFPIFSHSRLPGFNDILYPSAWDYMDKSVYAPNKAHPDPEWSEKSSDLFWRGSTTEGASEDSSKLAWQGMLRQRFVHLANNVKGTSPPSAILIPKGADEYMYESVPASELTALLSTDVQLAPDIARCRGRDCDLQRWEFAPTPNTTNLQNYWRYKYLLDLDGSGPSTSFLPFLRSKSLPFKAGILQEWWHDRVRPWVHFVPLDIRGLGFWSTLAWVAGINGTVNGRHVETMAHEKEAVAIADAGRQWAEASLRKEDMEIYLFRLLLEWARITDDWRDEIGFSMEDQRTG